MEPFDVLKLAGYLFLGTILIFLIVVMQPLLVLSGARTRSEDDGVNLDVDGYE